MMIPKEFQTGRRRYSVVLSAKLPYNDWGRIFYDHGVIKIATHVGRTKRTSYDMAETFWHEATHAILHDMRHPAHGDEVFVTEFSRRLTLLVHTAKL